MSKSRTSLKNQRNKAYNSQNGLCYYCKQPMWKTNPSDYASKYKVTIKSAISIFQCTGEHLTPHSERGTSKQTNIVAACKFCNQQRHRRKHILTPDSFCHFVQARICEGRWNSGILTL